MPPFRVISTHPFALPDGQPVAFGETVTLDQKDAEPLVERGRLAPVAGRPPRKPASTPTPTTSEAQAQGDNPEEPTS